MKSGGVRFAGDGGKVIALPVLVKCDAIRLALYPRDRILSVAGSLQRDTDPRRGWNDPGPRLVPASAS